MNKAFSLYLDLVRFAAACAVFVHHMVSRPFTDGAIWWRFGEYGSIAVTLFFVLSGYVIAYVTSTSEKTAREYFAARFSRLYSVVAVALVITILLDRAGLAFNPDFYVDDKVLRKPESLAGYLSSALFVNEYQVFGFNGISPGTNAPFWSLSFEVAYYAVAGVALFAPRKVFIPASLILLGLAGRTVIAMLPIWCLGFALYHLRLAVAIPKGAWSAMAITSGIAVVLAPEWSRLLPTLGIWLPWGRGPFNRNIVEDYAVAAAFAVHLISARGMLFGTGGMDAKKTAMVRWLGSLTFPLYCLHYPAICFLAAVSPWERSSFAHVAFITICTVALTIALTPVCEHLKRRIRATTTAAIGKRFGTGAVTSTR